MMSKQKWTNFNFLIYLKIDPTISIMFFFSNSNQNILLWIHLVSYCLNTSHRSCQLFKKNIKIDKMYFSIWPVYLISVDCAEWWNNLYEVCVLISIVILCIQKYNQSVPLCLLCTKPFLICCQLWWVFRANFIFAFQKHCNLLKTAYFCFVLLFIFWPRLYPVRIQVVDITCIT